MATYEEIRESIKKNAIFSIAQTIAGQVNGDYKVPFMHDQKAQDMSRAYNPSTGSSYEGLNSLLLDIKKAESKYPTNQWLSLKEMEILKADPQDIKNIKQNWREKAVKISYLQKKIVVPLHKLDENGQKVPLLDEKGNQRIGKNNEPLFEYELVSQIDKKTNQPKINPKTNEPFMNIKTETRELETPIYRTELLYNVAECPSLDKSKFKELDKSREYKHILKNAKDYEANVKKIVFEDIAKELKPTTREQIEEYFKAQNQGKDFIVPRGLNEVQKEQVQKIATNIVNNTKTETNEHTKESQTQSNKNQTKDKKTAIKKNKDMNR
ncbi:ArdC-like ssDNA-binding domain-containing protein [Helicobacter sp. 10-6591]|uniref:ArdC-like ssDNA-binding domain-containing protein n=1 Tax=Helicobacter sp. 10-6591 TaxID=2004998 RepID=UPI000DCD9EF2|nr:ArdC-like ssDNA-binding domain-containing protein [Helicobacter sp. 10-6591]RAX55483.1 hypothetical protein CCY97_04245 [Helicobacter sp. 10-6591]